MGKCQIVVSTSFFVPKPFTPFQWAGMFRKEDYLDKAKIVKEEIRAQLNQKSIKYNYHEADVTVLEGILARGDRRIADVLETAYRKGAIFDAWSEYFRYDLWMEAFEEVGLDPEFYTLRERPLDEIFPWDFISIGVSRKFLEKEWEKAHREEVTPNCKMKCSGCGAGVYKGGGFYFYWCFQKIPGKRVGESTSGRSDSKLQNEMFRLWSWCLQRRNLHCK